jgi:hypothetical protein
MIVNIDSFLDSLYCKLVIADNPQTIKDNNPITESATPKLDKFILLLLNPLLLVQIRIYCIY